MTGLRTYQRNKKDETCSCEMLVATDIQDFGVVYQVFIYRGWHTVCNHATYVFRMAR
jgi:hypothetical protein